MRAWLKKIGLGEADLECGTHPPRLQASIEALVRENALPTAAFNNCSGKHSGFLSTAVAYGEPTQGLHQVRPSGAARLRAVMTDLCGSNADDFAYGTDGCGIPTLATPLKSLARAMASMAEPSRLSNKHAEAAGRIRAAMNAEPFMMAGTGRFCTRINARVARRGADQDRRGGRVLRHAADPGPRHRASRCGTARRARPRSRWRPCSAISASCRRSRREELLHPPVKNVVGLLVGEMRPAKSWLG